MHLRLVTVVLWLSLLITPFVTTASAQTAGTLSGTITDASAAALPGVTVTARNTGTGLVRTVVTGGQGRYTIPALPPGTYEIRMELSGFTPQVRRDVHLAVAETLALNVT